MAACVRPRQIRKAYRECLTEQKVLHVPSRRSLNRRLFQLPFDLRPKCNRQRNHGSQIAVREEANDPRAKLVATTTNLTPLLTLMDRKLDRISTKARQQPGTRNAVAATSTPVTLSEAPASQTVVNVGNPTPPGGDHGTYAAVKQQPHGEVAPVLVATAVAQAVPVEERVAVYLLS
jgi:hypothetical protein